MEPLFIAGIGKMWNKVSTESPNSENLFFFRVGAALDFAVRRHRPRIGLESAFAPDERNIFIMASLSLGWGNGILAWISHQLFLVRNPGWWRRDLNP